jgi:hypothetical protein
VEGITGDKLSKQDFIKENFRKSSVTRFSLLMQIYINKFIKKSTAMAVPFDYYTKE